MFVLIVLAVTRLINKLKIHNLKLPAYLTKIISEISYVDYHVVPVQKKLTDPLLIISYL